MMVPALLTLLSCAHRSPAEGEHPWQQANIRKQEVMFMAEPGLIDGWLATQVPLAMAEELIGRDVLARCLADVEPDGECAVQVHDCMEVAVPKSWPEGDEPYVMVGFNIQTCPALMVGPNTQWTQTKRDGARGQAWTPPGAEATQGTAPESPPAETPDATP